MSNSPIQDSRSGQSAEQRRRKRKERAAKSRVPEPKDIVSGAGQPLDPGVRRELEERLGHDLSRVRLHTGRDAGQLAALLGADAVAVGQDIFFGEGTYRPGTDEGRRLLAHELLHTVQNPHGLGTLRAGRDLGAVSLPQQAIEREAESAAQDLIRGTEPGPDGASELDQAQATPGWLRYATVDADRRRMEQLDPATLVDRLAGGLLRSLRGDPEDRSGRVRIQLARMAPEVQDSVFDRLELRLPASVIDRLLEGVEETERAGPLPVDAAAAPLAVSGAAEQVGEERAREDSGAEGAPEQDARQTEPGRPGGKPQDGRPVPGGSREKEAGEQGGGSASGDVGRENAQGGAGSAARQQEASEDEQERSRDQQEDKDASGRDAQKDAADERKDASDTEREQRDQDGQDERDAEEDTGGPEDEAAQEPEKQAGEQGQREDEGAAEVARRQAPAPGPVDRSGAEPGEKSRTGGDTGTARAAGDPENEQDADDEPLGLDAEPELGDTEREAGDDTAGARAAGTDIDLLANPGDARNMLPVEKRKKGARPSVPSVPLEPLPEAVQDELEPDVSRSAAGRTEEDDPESQAAQDLSQAMSDQETGPEGEGGSAAVASQAPGLTGVPLTDAAGKDWDQRQAEQGAEDAQARRRDEDGGSAGQAGGTAPEPGEPAGSGQLDKAGEDARRQAAATSSSGTGGADPTAADGGSRTEGAGTGRTEGGADAPAKSEGRGEGAEANARKDEGRADGAAPGAGRPEQGDTPPQPAPGSQDVTEGKGPATIPGPENGPDKVSTPGPASAPKLAPGNGPSPMAAGPEAKTNTPKAAESPGSGGAPGGSTSSRSRPAGSKRQAARQAAKTASRRGGGGGGGRKAPAPAPVRSGGAGRSGGSKAKTKKEAPAPDVSNATPESGLSTAAGLKPHQALETLKGVGGAVGRSVDKERTTLRKAPPKMQRPSGSPRTVPGGPQASAPGTYTNAKVARTEAAPGKTPEITGDQKPEGEVPGANVPEPSWWDIAVTIGAQLLGKLLKEILPLDDLIDSILGLPTKDEGLRNARVGDAPRLPLENDSDPQRTDEQGRKLDERKNELHQSGREDAARNMGEDQIYPDVPKETLTGKVDGGKKGAKAGGARSVSGGGVPIESASAVAEHDRGPQIQAGFSQGRQKMGQERQAKDKKAADDRKQHDQDLQKEVSASGKKQSDARDKGRSDIADSRDRWREEQDDKVSEIDDKKGKKYDKVRDDIKKKEEDTDKDVDKRTEDDNKKIDDEQTNAEKEAEKKQQDGKDDADNWLEEAIEKLKEFFENLKNAIKSVFEKARQVVTDLIDKFKQQVFKLIDDARNWVIDQINTFADALIALGDELLADYPAMRDKWRNTIDGARDWAVQKVNEAADALKEVAGKLLDGLCGALLAGLDALEGGLLAAVDIAETVTVGALEFGAAAVAALGEWAAIFNDIVSDPGDWISKAGAAAETGAKEHLFEEIKAAVKAWFNQKVQEIIGIPMEDFQELVSGGVTVEQMAQMAWDEALPQLPVIIGVMVVEKVVAKLIPGAGWVMAIIDALQTAWGALSEILAAFGLFMDFLKSVKSGNGALPFAKAVAAGVVALLELVYEFLIEGVSRFMGKVAERLGDMLKNLRTKKNKPGQSDGPAPPDAPAKDKQSTPTDDRTPASDRPAPRRPTGDKTSRPPSKPRPGKRSAPEKKPRPSHTTRPKKRRDDDERREEGRDVNAARKRMRDADRRMRDDDRGERSAGPARRGTARDTLRPDRRPDTKDRDRDRDPKDTRPGDRPTNDRRRDDDRGVDRRRDDGRRRDEDRPNDRRLDDDRRRDTGRDRPRPLRRARQTVKSAVNRARRAARRLYGKARRRVGGRLNDRLRRMRDLWRRRRDRLRDDRANRRDRENRERRDERHTRELVLPTARFRADTGETHTLMFHGKGRAADLYVHSIPEFIPGFLEDWKRQVAGMQDSPDKSEQRASLKQAEVRHRRAETLQGQLPTRVPRGGGRASWQTTYEALRIEMAHLAAAMRRRHNGVPKPKPKIPNFTDHRMGKNFTAKYLDKLVKGTPSTDADTNADIPIGWLYAKSINSDPSNRWVRMHLLPDRIGGPAKGSNMVPASGPEVNTPFLHGVEEKAYQALHADPAPEEMIWYDVQVQFHKPPASPARGFPKFIQAVWGGYTEDRQNRRWEPDAAAQAPFNALPDPPSVDRTLYINRADVGAIKRTLKETGYEFSQALLRLRPYNKYSDLETAITKYDNSKPTVQKFHNLKERLDQIKTLVDNGIIKFEREPGT